jgi:hypothetical protein
MSEDTQFIMDNCDIRIGHAKGNCFLSGSTEESPKGDRNHVNCLVFTLRNVWEIRSYAKNAKDAKNTPRTAKHPCSLRVQSSPSPL